MNVTIYSPSQVQERSLGYDDRLYGLPKARILVFQFKKPYSYNSSKKTNFVRFRIDTKQLEVLLNGFKPGEAFYVFVGLSKFREISHRHELLKYSIGVDIHDIPNGKKVNQKTRTVSMVKSGLAPMLETRGNLRLYQI